MASCDRRPTFALSKAYAEARKEHGQSELLDQIVSAKPEFDRHRYHSPQELHELGLQRLRDAAALLAQKASPDELASYRGFVLTLAQKVASAHEEHGERVGAQESEALEQIRSAVGASG